jgi:SAM-dependent methyltransferase
MTLKEEIIKICSERYPYEMDYVNVHLERYCESFEYIERFLKPGDKILELGSNNNGSTFIELIKTKFNCDIDFYDKDLRYEFDIESDKYDFVICMEIIEHIKDRESHVISEISQFNWNGMDNLMKEINRCLKKDGLLFITTPNACSYACILKILYHENPTHYLPHVKEFAYFELLEYIEKFNFKVISSETKDPWKTKQYPIDKFKIFEILKDNNISVENREQNTYCISKKI